MERLLTPPFEVVCVRAGWWSFDLQAGYAAERGKSIIDSFEQEAAEVAEEAILQSTCQKGTEVPIASWPHKQGLQCELSPPGCTAFRPRLGDFAHQRSFPYWCDL